MYTENVNYFMREHNQPSCIAGIYVWNKALPRRKGGARRKTQWREVNTNLCVMDIVRQRYLNALKYRSPLLGAQQSCGARCDEVRCGVDQSFAATETVPRGFPIGESHFSGSLSFKT